MCLELIPSLFKTDINYNPRNKFRMYNQQEEDWDYKYYLNNKDQLPLPAKAHQYFKLLDDIVKKKKKPSDNSIIPFKLLKAFSLLSKQQQIRYITENLKYLANAKKLGSNLQQNQYVLCKQPKTIMAKCQKKSGLFCFYAPKMTIKLQTGSRTLLISDQKYIKMVDLQNYLVRQGNKMFKNVIQLQPIIQSKSLWQQIKNYKFTLPEKQFNKIYDEIFNCIMDIRNEQLAQLFIDSRQLHELRKVSSSQKQINKIQYEQFRKFKRTILQEGIKYLKYQNKIHEQFDKNSQLVIWQNNQKPSMFKLQIFSDLEQYELKQKFQYVCTQNKSSLLVQSQVLQTYQQSCLAILQKYQIGRKQHSIIYMRQIQSLTNLLMTNKLSSIISIQDRKRYEDFMFIKSINGSIADNFINYICAFMTSNPPNKLYRSCLILIGQFNLNKNFNIQAVKQFLSQYYYSIFQIPRKKQYNQQTKDTNKITNEGNKFKVMQSTSTDKNSKHSQQIPKQVIVEFDQPHSPQFLPKLSRNKFKSSEQVDHLRLNKVFLTHKFQLKPIPGYNIFKNLVKQNFMSNQWKKKQSGGLICINQKLLSEQKKIIKHIMSSMGANLLKGNNVLNVSLPVTIFNKKGHMHIVADSFSIAPRLFQNVSDRVERIKKSVILSVAVGTLGISAQKPFFPTLGETLQVWIAGCPMYIQQIVRYPPTQQYMFYGRGYKIIGQIQPKISLGLNGGKGYSQRPSHIIFDDGQKIQLSYAKLSISGFIIGDRQFNFEDKAFAYDMQNNYFAQIIFGPRDTKFFGKNGQTKDFVYGKIYQISPQFAYKFQNKAPPKPFPHKQQIIRTISSFEGFWNGIIQFDGKQYINFATDLPSVVQNQEFALPSDTRFRADLSNLILDNIQQAQKQKQVIEQLQRRDRKLRQQKAKRK